MASVVFAPMRHHFVRHNVAIRHAQQLRQRTKWTNKIYPEGSIINSYERVVRAHLSVKDPCTGRSSSGIDDPVKAINHIMCGHPSSTAIGKQNIVLEENIIAQVKSIYTTIIAYIPAFGQRRYGMQVFISFYQCIIYHVVYPHHVQVLGICGVYRFKYPVAIFK